LERRVSTVGLGRGIECDRKVIDRANVKNCDMALRRLPIPEVNGFDAPGPELTDHLDQGPLGAIVEVDRGSHPLLAACQPRPARFGGIAAQSISHPMTRCNVAQRLALAVERASADQPTLKTKRVSPHTLRHTTAMHLLQSGVPFNIIALWLGHESTNTTHRYVEANLEMKEKALARLEAPDIKLKRFRASDDLLKFLQSL